MCRSRKATSPVVMNTSTEIAISSTPISRAATGGATRYSDDTRRLNTRHRRLCQSSPCPRLVARVTLEFTHCHGTSSGGCDDECHRRVGRPAPRPRCAARGRRRGHRQLALDGPPADDRRPRRVDARVGASRRRLAERSSRYGAARAPSAAGPHRRARPGSPREPRPRRRPRARACGCSPTSTTTCSGCTIWPTTTSSWSWAARSSAGRLLECSGAVLGRREEGCRSGRSEPP